MVQPTALSPRDGSWREGSPHLAILWRRKWLIGLVALGSALCALVFTLAQRPEYTATAVVHVATRSSLASDQVRPDDLTYVDRLENTYADLATSRGLVDELARDVGLSERPGVEVQAVPNTELMDIDVTTHDRDTAAAAANRLAALLIARVRALNLANRGAETDLASRIERIQSDLTAMRNEYGTLATAIGPASPQQSAQLLELKQEINASQSRLRTLQDSLDSMRLAREERANSLSVVEPALPPSTPSNRHLFRNLAVALLVGLVGGIGVAYLAERVRPRLHGEVDVEAAAGAPILASVPYVRAEDGSSEFNGGSSADEAFRRLRLAIFAGKRPRLKRHAFVITSPERGDGKTTVAANLARTVAQAGRRVVLVDADLRRPALHTHFAQPGEPGLRDVLEGTRTADVIQPTDVPNLFLMPAGAPSDRAGQLLEAADWPGLLKKLRAEFDVVLVDGPPVLDVSDPLVLAAPSDGVLLVLRSPNVPRDLLGRAQQQINAAGGQVLGLVVNRTERHRKHTYSWGSSSHE